MICKLSTDGNYKAEINNNLGELIPKDGNTWRVLLRIDNPDINSITTELKLIRQALEEYSRRVKYGVKVYSEYPEELVDCFIDFIEPFDGWGDSTLADAGYPFGKSRGKIRINNKFVWLDGFKKTGAELRELGIILPGMDDLTSYKTYNIRQTVKHEFGHIIGLEHSTDENAVMRAIYSINNIMLGKTSLAMLEIKYGLRNVGSRWMSYILSSIKRQVFK